MSDTNETKSRGDMRVELILEGIENFARAVAVKDLAPPSPSLQVDEQREAEYQRARAELFDALHLFIMPLVRLVDGGLEGQPLVDEAFKCQKCGASKRCQLDCADWHATIRAKVNTADETFPICPVCDCPDDPSILCCEKKCPRRDRGETA